METGRNVEKESKGGEMKRKKMERREREREKSGMEN